MDKQPPSSSSIMVKVGSWFEASATGWGIVALPLVLIAGLVLAWWASSAS